jgi:hypothetical protein
MFPSVLIDFRRESALAYRGCQQVEEDSTSSGKSYPQRKKLEQAIQKTTELRRNDDAKKCQSR